MKINFQTQNMQDISTTSGAATEKTTKKSQPADYRISIFGGENNLPGTTVNGVDKGKSLIELQQTAENTSVGVTQDYMTLMSHTMSEEDYARMQEEGFDFSGAEPEEVVTIVDKIKAELVKSGVNVEGYTDDMSLDTLREALGSDSLARALYDSFRQADLPTDTVEPSEVKMAWDMAQKLHSLTESDIAYLTDNGMTPEVWNLYLAQNSGAGQSSAGTPKFYAEDVKGYFAVNAANTGKAAFSGGLSAEQISKHLEQLGIEANDKNMQQAEWLVDKGLPLTGESLQLLEKYQSVELPVTEEHFAQSVAAAAAEGKKPVNADLSQTETIYQRAAGYVDYFADEANWTSMAGDVTARRQLEEVRLRMTAEVNVRLLKSGFAIDTAPMEALVEALKQAEQQVAQSLFPDAAEPVEQYHLYTQTNQAVKTIPGLPAQVLNRFIEADAESVLTLRQLQNEGTALQTELAKAGEAYETLMTAPRSDLGDSIKKAFANVDTILTDMGLELTEANQKVVRILGYNHMAIDAANIERVKEAQARIETVINKMTPASTLQMIRDGVNPLTTDLQEINAYFDALPEDYLKESEGYARFLYGLEKNQSITQEERESYIGIYRLVHQLEKSDGAAVGALVNTGAELQFSNLLTAIRSHKFKGMDVKANDELGTLSELVKKGESISDQIAKAFISEAKEMLTEVSQSEEINKQYVGEQLEELRRAAKAPQEAVDLVIKAQQPLNASQILAAEQMLEDISNPYKALRDKVQHMKAQPETLWQGLEAKDAFLTDYQDTLEAMQDEVEEFTFGENAQQLSSVDVRELRMHYMQLGILDGVAAKGAGTTREEYMLPMYIGEQLTRVHLTMEQGKQEKGMVTVSWEAENGEQLQARLHMQKQEQGAVLTWTGEGKSQAALMELDKVADIFSEMAADSWTVERSDSQMQYTEQATVSIGNMRVKPMIAGISENAAVTEAAATESIDNTELYKVAKIVLQAIERGRR